MSISVLTLLREWILTAVPELRSLENGAVQEINQWQGRR